MLFPTLLLLLPLSSALQDLNLGVIIAQSDHGRDWPSHASDVIAIAVDIINNNPLLLPGFRIVPHINNSNCDPKLGLIFGTQLLTGSAR